VSLTTTLKLEAGYRKKWYHMEEKKYEKIVIKKENTTNPNVK